MRTCRLVILFHFFFIAALFSCVKDSRQNSQNRPQHTSNITGSHDVDFEKSDLWSIFKSVVRLELGQGVRAEDVRGSYDAACNGVFVAEKIMLTSENCFAFTRYTIDNFDEATSTPFLLNGIPIASHDIAKNSIVTSKKNKNAKVRVIAFATEAWNKIKTETGSKFFAISTDPVQSGDLVMLAGWGNNENLKENAHNENSRGWGHLRFGFNYVTKNGPFLFFQGTDEPGREDMPPVFAKTALGDRGSALFYVQGKVSDNYELTSTPKLLGIAWWDSAYDTSVESSGASFVVIDAEMAHEILNENNNSKTDL